MSLLRTVDNNFRRFTNISPSHNCSSSMSIPTDNYGVDSLFYAVKSKDIIFVKTLLSTGIKFNFNEEDFLDLCDYGPFEIFKLVLERNIEFLNYKSKNGANPFLQACAAGKWDFAKHVLDLKPEFLYSTTSEGHNAYIIANSLKRNTVCFELISLDPEFFLGKNAKTLSGFYKDDDATESLIIPRKHSHDISNLRKDEICEGKRQEQCKRHSF